MAGSTGGSGWAAGVGVAEAGIDGRSDWPSEARLAAAGVPEKYRSPFWPQAEAKAATMATPRMFCILDMAEIMTETEFMDRAERLLAAVEACCDRINDESDADLDNQRVGGMVTLVFRNRSQIVVNLQKPLSEVWLASQTGGYHYRFADGQWRDTKGGAEFFAQLSRDASAQAGQALQFSS